MVISNVVAVDCRPVVFHGNGNPVVFLTEVVKAALTDAVEKGITFTDDATAVERLGMTIQAVEGEEENLKLTTPQDLVIAQGILERRRGAAK